MCTTKEFKRGEVIMADRCTTCGEAIAEGEAEFDGDDGRIGLPHHPVCLSMPESLKAKLSRCPACGHMEGSHMDVTAFDAFTGKIRATYTACSCGCKYYLTPRGVG
jgi:ribosomal protein L32